MADGARRVHTRPIESRHGRTGRGLRRRDGVRARSAKYMMKTGAFFLNVFEERAPCVDATTRDPAQLGHADGL